MGYKDRFKELLITTAKGFGVGFVIAIILVIAIGTSGIGEFIGATAFFTILFGSAIAMVICSRSGMQGYMSGAVIRLWDGIKRVFFSSIFGGNIYLLILGIIKMFIGIVIAIPIGIFMALSYFFNLFYLGIMALLESKNQLENKAALCQTLDKLVPALAGIITAILCILILKGI